MGGIDRPYIDDETLHEILEHSMHGELKYTLMNDFLAKYSLQKDLFALKGLLAALLDLELYEIYSIEIKNPITPGEYIQDKDCILDIRLELNNHSIINIEIQTRFQAYWAERSLLYLSKNFDHLKEGESYKQLKPCVQIGILDNDVFHPQDPRYTGELYARYRMLNVKTHTEYTGKFEIRVLSLKNIEHASEAEKEKPNGVYQWAKLFAAQTWEELKMVAEKNERMQSFVGTVRQLSAEERVAQVCEARRKYLSDMATLKECLEDVTKQLEEETEKVKKESERAKKESERANEAEKKAKEAEEEIKKESARADQAEEEIRRLRQQLEKNSLAFPC
ncbi:MAG: PD-(D/E)XK nuclease family transposase [Lachnospiraceae bacterium]|nr:Rpn family recombination-promoting nuclease/putative transposase [Lachnospiraceae bacterium]MDY3818607.1 PD-(D/E)XK nuclease family transposase [Lachnospiraceae bacterium]